MSIVSIIMTTTILTIEKEATAQSLQKIGIQSKWFNQWKNISAEDQKEYHTAIGHTLYSTTNSINDLLAAHATYSNPKFSVFNKELKEILNKNSLDIKNHANKFAREIESEAHNTYKLKIQKNPLNTKINSVKNSRKNRKAFINHEQK